MTWNNKVTGPWRKASWLSALDQHHSTNNMSIHHPPANTHFIHTHTKVERLVNQHLQPRGSFIMSKGEQSSFLFLLPFQSIEGLGLKSVLIYLQPHIDLSPSGTFHHQPARGISQGHEQLGKRLVKTVIFHLNAFKKRHMNEGWNNNSAVERHMPLSRPPPLSSQQL